MSIHRPQGGRHTQASQGVGHTAAYDRPRGRSPRGSLEGGLGEVGATESLSAAIQAGGNPPPQPLLVAVGHGTQMPTFSFLPRQMVTRTKKIFVGGLSVNTTVEDVKHYFEQFGKVGLSLWVPG